MDSEQMEAAKAIAALHQQRIPKYEEYGYIATYKPSGQVTVYLPHDLAAGNNVTRGPYPLEASWVGNGWGLQVGLVGGGLDGSGNPLGEPCVITYPDPEGEMGTVRLRGFNSKYLAPGAPSGELWAMHKNGQTIKLTNDGNAQITGAAVYLGAPGLDGTHAVIRKSDFDAFRDKVNAAISVFNAHAHVGNLGSPTSGPLTSQTATSTTASSAVFAE
jgi:hypothetical protein